MLHRATVDEIASSRSLARRLDDRHVLVQQKHAPETTCPPAGCTMHPPCTLHTALEIDIIRLIYIYMHLTSPVISQSYAGRWKTQDRTKSRRRRRLFARSCRFSSPSILSVIFQSHIVNANASTSTTKQCIA